VNKGEGRALEISDQPLSREASAQRNTGSTLLMLGAAIAGFVFLRWKMPAV
jgi:hypothetical protein